MKLNLKSLISLVFFTWPIILAIALLMSCSGLPVQNSSFCATPSSFIDRNGDAIVMEDPSQTAICKVDPFWSETKLSLLVVNNVALRKKLYTPEQARAGVMKIRQALDIPGATIGSIAAAAIGLIGTYPELYIATTTLEDYTNRTDLPIDEFSYYHINKHLLQQLGLIAMFEGM
jgi:hypothetical protein